MSEERGGNGKIRNIRRSKVTLQIMAGEHWQENAGKCEKMQENTQEFGGDGARVHHHFPANNYTFSDQIARKLEIWKFVTNRRVLARLD